MTDQSNRKIVRMSTLLSSGACAEDDLRAAILCDKVRPILFIEESHRPFKKWAEDGSHSYDPIEDSDDGDSYELFNGEIYLAKGTWTDLFEADFHLFTKVQDEEAGITPLPIYSLDAPVSLSYLLGKGGLMASDVRLIAAWDKKDAVVPAVKPLAPGDSVSSYWPWGSHTTAALGHLDAAARRWWALYDRDDPTTAPTNEEVSNWLQTERSVSKARADAIASMLRPDDLRTGPRR
ncbi:hypothetical protein EJP67_02265 [Variovorax guangxiensis]|uniref:Uncharacterized protein n=1 Tax=Variovorax guangxiensis TaxID=1775474 RepID=A0A433MDA0_9BURK|nr:hypothetical protein [Variovorax guangxiensis]RUR65878.1 hypothetical protein EJP67_02265 [Variovorax guangxiensis]